MVISKLWTLLLVLAAAAFAASCGGGEDSEEAPRDEATAPAAAVSPTLAPGATVTAQPQSTAAPGGSSAGQSALARALVVAPIELDNVRYGGTYKPSTNASPPHFDPKLVQSSVIYTFGGLFYETLVDPQANVDNQYVHMGPELAESWTASQDVKTYTFKLRQGIKWHNIAPVNGRELVADDFIYSFNRYLDQQSAAYSAWQQVDSIEAPDKSTVVIRLKDPNAWALNDLFSRGEYVVAREVVEEGGGTITTKVVGTGPFILSEFVRNRLVMGVRNPDYWGKDAKGNRLPYVDTWRIDYIPEPVTALAALRTGQVDSGSLTPEAQLIAAESIPDLRIYNLQVTTANMSLGFNTKKAPWNDVRVRRAFGMLLDQKKFVQQEWGDKLPWAQAQPLPWVYVSDEPFTFEKLGPYHQFNPSEARKLLIEAGFQDGKMKINSNLVFNYPGRSPNGPLLQQLYKEQGIDFPISYVDGSVFNTRYYQRAGEDLDFTYSIGTDFTLAWFAQNKFLLDASQNTSFINDPQVTETVKKIKVTSDPAKLREYAKFLWDFNTLGMWSINLPNNIAITINAGRVRNYLARAGNNDKMPWLADAPRTSP